MRILHNLAIGAGIILLDPFAGDPVIQRGITVPGNTELTNDFGRIAADFQRALDAARTRRSVGDRRLSE